jgi:hypothetical protein
LPFILNGLDAFLKWMGCVGLVSVLVHWRVSHSKRTLLSPEKSPIFQKTPSWSANRIVNSERTTGWIQCWDISVWKKTKFSLWLDSIWLRIYSGCCVGIL